MMTRKEPKNSSGDRRVTISVRNVSEKKWKMLQKLADERGLKLRYVLDEIFDEWIKRNSEAK
jgi:hypothetical protein